MASSSRLIQKDPISEDPSDLDTQIRGLDEEKLCNLTYTAFKIHSKGKVNPHVPLPQEEEDLRPGSTHHEYAPSSPPAYTPAENRRVNSPEPRSNPVSLSDYPDGQTSMTQRSRDEDEDSYAYDGLEEEEAERLMQFRVEPDGFTPDEIAAINIVNDYTVGSTHHEYAPSSPPAYTPAENRRVNSPEPRSNPVSLSDYPDGQTSMTQRSRDEDEDSYAYDGLEEEEAERLMQFRVEPDGFTPDEIAAINIVNDYTPEIFDLEPKFRPFQLEYIPSIGDIDAFIKVPRPDEVDDNIGYTELDEPAPLQSDPAIVGLQIWNAIKETAGPSEVPVKKLDRADRNKDEIDNWIKNIRGLHRNRPSPMVTYKSQMPDIERLMQEWPEEFQDKLRQLKSYSWWPSPKFWNVEVELISKYVPKDQESTIDPDADLTNEERVQFSAYRKAYHALWVLAGIITLLIWSFVIFCCCKHANAVRSKPYDNIIMTKTH